MVSPLGIVAETPAQVQGRVLIFRLAVVTNCVCAIETMEVRMTEKRSSNFFMFYNVFSCFTLQNYCTIYVWDRNPKHYNNLLIPVIDGDCNIAIGKRVLKKRCNKRRLWRPKFLAKWRRWSINASPPSSLIWLGYLFRLESHSSRLWRHSLSVGATTENNSPSWVRKSYITLLIFLPRWEE